MMFPGTPAHPYVYDGDDQAFAAWMLTLLDEGSQSFATISLTYPGSMDAVDDMEEMLIRGYDIAKAERPNLSVKILPAIHRAQVGPRGSDALVILHEHEWVGGMCVNGCTDRREVGCDG